ncbi:LysR substrate-binding domain-containing protein [Kitasatospora sp. NPDC091335]|uniref:LysR substrate-binding domain-containing protein n=1 Tax=Kitasatospora sp. NPDC091335 TaxID=3364085 RepID=UPI003813AD13
MIGASWWQLLLAPLFAFVLGQLALLGHDVAHRAVFAGRRAADLAGILLGNLVVGMSCGWRVDDHNRHHAHPKVRDGEIDAAVVAGPPDGEPAGVAPRVLLEDRIVAVLPAGSRPSNRPMALCEAVGGPVISYGPDSGAHAFVREAFATAGLRLDIACATNDVALQLALVAEGIGIALTSRASPVLAADRRFTVVPLEPAIRLRKVFVWRAGTRPSVPLRAFLDLWTELSDRPAPDGPAAGATIGG